MIMSPSIQQSELFATIMLPKISFFLQGYNSAVFAYGATSSGKTYTILGPDSIIDSLNIYQITESCGILPRSFNSIIEGYEKIKMETQIQQVTLKATYVEIYNEQIYDLLNQQYKTNNQKVDLKISSVSDGPKLIGVREIQVENVNDLMELIVQGSYNRSIGTTQYNSRSSRSHVIFTIELFIEWKDKSQRTSKIWFVDLAGSERLAKSVSKGQVLEETKKINQSLACLGHCIMALSSKKQHKHVPYRDSKLTLLLKECLGGNSNTSFICAVSSTFDHEEKTIQTLKFAQRAKLICNKVKLNLKLSYEQIEKQMSFLKQELSIMEKILLMNGIKYDKQFLKEQPYSSEPSLNIEQLSDEYRKSIKQQLHKSKTIQEQFSFKFQQYLQSEQLTQSGKNMSSPNSRRITSSRRKSSLPCSLEASDIEVNEQEEADNSLNEGQLFQAIKQISETPQELQQFMSNRSTQIKFQTVDSQQQSTQAPEIQITNKSRDGCCQIF